MKLNLLGTASAQGWPQAGCPCASCRSARASPRRATQLVVDDLLELPTAGNVAPDGWQIHLLGCTNELAVRTATGELLLYLSTDFAARVVAGTWTANAGNADAGNADAGNADAGNADAGNADAGNADAGNADAGNADAGNADAGNADAGNAQKAVELAGATAIVLRMPESDGQPLRGVALALSRLRQERVITPASLVLAVSLGHNLPPEPELIRQLRALGVLVPHDAEELDTTLRTAPELPARRTLVIGGTRSGKSEWAERQLSADAEVRYLATAPSGPRAVTETGAGDSAGPGDSAGLGDSAWDERIRVHRLRRPSHWRTVQTLDIGGELAAACPLLLIEDLGNWVAATLDATQGWNGDLAGYLKAASALVAAWRQFAGRAILVCPAVGGGVHPRSASGRLFVDEVGRLSTALSAESDEVVTVTAGLAQWLRRPPGMI